MAFVSGIGVGNRVFDRSLSVSVRKGLHAPRLPGRLTPRMASEVDKQVEVASGPEPSKGNDSYVKLAMRNMVQQSAKAIVHFGMTASVLILFLVGLAFLFK
uniref:Uncharacterized protein n=1 Tax=Rhodosorus marinus TaxID=101924 RepID=A0A7S3A2E5_9RHOD|mmetsp:Transcript_38407/g.151680  ORF Transcript_38407/g.151680 Transcript_38407/m.151680 type:complete len:101 (+) Transcript_38407:204-506(+)